MPATHLWANKHCKLNRLLFKPDVKLNVLPVSLKQAIFTDNIKGSLIRTLGLITDCWTEDQTHVDRQTHGVFKAFDLECNKCKKKKVFFFFKLMYHFLTIFYINYYSYRVDGILIYQGTKWALYLITYRPQTVLGCWEQIRVSAV